MTLLFCAFVSPASVRSLREVFLRPVVALHRMCDGFRSFVFCASKPTHPSSSIHPSSRRNSRSTKRRAFHHHPEEKDLPSPTVYRLPIQVHFFFFFYRCRSHFSPNVRRLLLFAAAPSLWCNNRAVCVSQLQVVVVVQQHHYPLRTNNNGAMTVPIPQPSQRWAVNRTVWPPPVPLLLLHNNNNSVPTNSGIYL